MGLSIIWLGHASFQIKINEKNIYTDPYMGKYNDKADIILITHPHFDHCDPSKIKRIKQNNTLIIGPKNCGSKIEGKIKTLKPGEKVDVEGITIKAVEAYNYKRFRSPGEPFHPKGLGVGYLISFEGKTIYHAGDTDFIPEMRQFEKVHIALLPSGGTYTMDNEEAAEAALIISPDIVLPMHRWDSDTEVFKKKIESKSEIKVIILEPGQQIEIE